MHLTLILEQALSCLGFLDDCLDRRRRPVEKVLGLDHDVEGCVLVFSEGLVCVQERVKFDLRILAGKTVGKTLLLFIRQHAKQLGIELLGLGELIFQEPNTSNVFLRVFHARIRLVDP